MNKKSPDPATIYTDKTDLSKIDPVKVAYKNLGEALGILNEVSDRNPKEDEILEVAKECIRCVLDQLVGWDCSGPYRLVKPEKEIVPYRSDLKDS